MKLVSYCLLSILLFQDTPLGSSIIQHKVELVNESTEGAPLLGTGTLIYSSQVAAGGVETQYQTKATLLNVSPKPIVAFDAVEEITVDYAVGDRTVVRYDAYFDDKPLMPNTSWDISDNPRVSRTEFDKNKSNLQRLPKESKSSFEIKILFARFIDGSEFGASDWAKNLPRQRNELRNLMNYLLKEYNMKGDAGLSLAIEKELGGQDTPQNDRLSFLLGLRTKVREKGGAFTGEYLGTCLENANKHTDWH